MKSFSVLEDLAFNPKNPHAEVLAQSQNGRVLRFALLPGQEIQAHKAPGSALNILLLKGKGKFRAGDYMEGVYGPLSLLTFEPGEEHAVLALDDELVFLAFLQDVVADNP